ncbi:MAG: phosphoribosylformylglycinamidine synthase subunit PurS [Myxococcota bacterium]
MRARIFVTLKRGVLDPQGRAIQEALTGLGHEGVQDVRQGKLFELSLSERPEAEARETLERMCQQLLANLVIEDYRIELHPSGGRP